VQDAEAIAVVQVRGWFAAYADFVDPQEMALHDVDRRIAVWREQLAPDAAGRAWVWDQNGRVAGFAVSGPSRDTDAVPELGELYGLYVDPVAQNAGVGRALLRRAEGDLRGRGFAEATLWVFEQNLRARRFYEGHGWTLEEGSGDLTPPDWWAPALRYRRPL
jgi:ribosomal protein S18 acetylase RimI-like enzyme